MAPLAYDIWESLRLHFQNIQNYGIAPEDFHTIQILKNEYPNDDHKCETEYQRLALQIAPVAAKLESDSLNGGYFFA